MKSSGSEWDLDEFLRPLMAADGAGDYFSGGFSGADLLFSGDRGSINNSHSTGELVGGTQMLSQSLTTPKHSAVVSPTVETQSSICAGSPTSSSKPKGHDNQVRGGTSGSEQSDDDESQEIEGGSCEQSSITDLKRMRRMVSNRESARRSRKRKQAHLAELESQVDKLRGENASLYKQLADANQHFSEAVTDNRVLKSDVEALRVKVKMALDLVARGSLTCSLDNLLQSHIGSVQMLNSQLPCRASEVLPTIEVPTDDVFNGGVQVHNIEMDSRENIKSDNNMNSTRLNQNSAMQSIPGLDVTSCGATDVWSWDSHSISVSK